MELQHQRVKVEFNNEIGQYEASFLAISSYGRSPEQALAELRVAMENYLQSSIDESLQPAAAPEPK